MPVTAPTTVTPGGINLGFDMSNEAFNNMLRANGITNCRPPLPKSSHLKVMRTGKIYPWSEALAVQFGRVVNCDVHGNTDEEAWNGTYVEPGDVDYTHIESAVMEHMGKFSGYYQADDMRPAARGTKSFPEGAVFMKDVQRAETARGEKPELWIDPEVEARMRSLMAGW